MQRTMRELVTLCELFDEQVATRSDRVAVHCRDRDVTYGQLAAQAASFRGRLLRAGLEPGDRVALLMPNSPEYVACYLGTLQAGGVVVALNPETTVDELSYTLADAAPLAVVLGARAIEAFEQIRGRIESLRLVVRSESESESESEREAAAHFHSSLSPRPARPPQLDDLAQIIYTSGTTGRPKGVMLTHRNIAANCRSIVSYLELTAEDSVLVALPFFYSYGNSLLFTHLAVGGRLVLATDFVFWNRVLDLMERQRVTGFSGVPSSFAMLLHRSDFGRRAFPKLRYMTCAGGALAPAVVERLRAVVPHVRLFPMYGQTEATARLSTLLPEELDRKPGSIGRGIPGVRLRVVDDTGRDVPPGVEGEIVATGENIMCGYWGDAAETARVLRPDGLHTGDLAQVDADGYIYITGRRSDLIKSGAYRINPQEIEQVILQLDGVAEVAVVGIADPIWGESPTAVVVPTREGELAAAEILAHCRRHLPRYKQVRDVHFATSLPRTSSGKVRRRALRESLACPEPAEALLSH